MNKQVKINQLAFVDPSEFKDFVLEHKRTDNVSQFKHKTLPIMLWMVDNTHLSLAYFIMWKSKNIMIKELMSAHPNHISEEEFNLYILKYSNI